MKILFIAHEKDLNGASKSMLELIKCLQRKNEIFVLTQYSKGKFITALKKAGIHIITFPYYRWIDRNNYRFRWILYKFRWHIFGDRVNEKTAMKVAELVKEKGINIIHTNSSVIDIGIRVHRMINVSHVMHIREFGDMDFNMIPFLSYELLYSLMNTGTNKFICISKAISSHYPKLNNKEIIYNGVSKSNICYEKKNYCGQINILMAGRISEEKGQYLAVKAIQKLVREGITEVKLYLAGNGKMRIPTDIESKVELLGYVDDMPTLRRKMHIEIVGSKAEAFGRVTVEAMMGGLIVIGSDTGGTPELIDNGKNGFLFKNGDDADLAEKLKYLFRHREIMSIISDTARTYAIKNYSIERCSRKIENLYCTLR